jgi:hypothetical protein
MGLTSLGQYIGIFWNLLYCIFLLNVILGLEFLGLALSPPQALPDRVPEPLAAAHRGRPSRDVHIVLFLRQRFQISGPSRRPTGGPLELWLACPQRLL